VENHHAINGKINYKYYKWPFSIAMLNYQRVNISNWENVENPMGV